MVAKVNTTLETWEMKAKRLALARNAARPGDESPSTKQRLAYRQASYELDCHLNAVTDD